MISAQKLKLIHVARRELELTAEAYHEILRHHGGVETAKQLDDDSFKRVIDCMKALGFWVRRAYVQDKPRDPGALPTIAQMKVIGHLWADLSEYLAGANLTQYQRGFYAKALKLPGLGPQTRTQANKVIEILKQRLQREMRKGLNRRPDDPPRVG
jgi:phage gp16-like protein